MIEKIYNEMTKVLQETGWDKGEVKFARNKYIKITEVYRRRDNKREGVHLYFTLLYDNGQVKYENWQDYFYGKKNMDKIKRDLDSVSYQVNKQQIMKKEFNEELFKSRNLKRKGWKKVKD